MTKIEWTERTWNPIVGCSIVSPGCTNCYAMRMAKRLAMMDLPHYRDVTQHSKAGPVWTGKVNLAPEKTLLEPLRRKKPTMYFVNSMSDLFHESVPDEWIDQVFAVMALCPQHTFQVLTKRAERMREYIGRRTGDWQVVLPEAVPHGWSLKFDGACLVDWPLKNCWLGVSAEDQLRADERREHLRALAEAGWLSFVSFEPALGLVDWKGWEWLSWLISGGESGPDARPSHPDWHRAARDFCQAHGIAYFFKQWGQWASAKGYPGDMPIDHVFDDGYQMVSVGKKRAGRLLDGRTWDEMPAR